MKLHNVEATEQLLQTKRQLERGLRDLHDQRFGDSVISVHSDAYSPFGSHLLSDFPPEESRRMYRRMACVLRVIMQEKLDQVNKLLETM
mgnify:CR=1 FL=1